MCYTQSPALSGTLSGLISKPSMGALGVSHYMGVSGMGHMSAGESIVILLVHRLFSNRQPTSVRGYVFKLGSNISTDCS